MSKLHTENVT